MVSGVALIAVFAALAGLAAVLGLAAYRRAGARDTARVAADTPPGPDPRPAPRD
jgi:hypothetical protein